MPYEFSLAHRWYVPISYGKYWMSVQVLSLHAIVLRFELFNFFSPKDGRYSFFGN